MRVVKHRDVHQVLQSRLEIAIQEAEVEDFITFIAVNIEMFYQYDFPLGKCPGFIRAQHIHGTEVLD